MLHAKNLQELSLYTTSDILIFGKHTLLLNIYTFQNMHFMQWISFSCLLVWPSFATPQIKLIKHIISIFKAALYSVRRASRGDVRGPYTEILIIPSLSFTCSCYAHVRLRRRHLSSTGSRKCAVLYVLCRVNWEQRNTWKQNANPQNGSCFDWPWKIGLFLLHHKKGTLWELMCRIRLLEIILSCSDGIFHKMFVNMHNSFAYSNTKYGDRKS